MNKIPIANFFAKYSCTKWNKIRVIRVTFRITYHAIMEIGAVDYPYANREFAKWPESGTTAIVDAWGFVIRHCTSYCAWMVWRCTGKGLKKPKPGFRKPGENAWDAKHWDELLLYNGWQPVNDLSSLVAKRNIPGCCCIGLIPDEGRYGLVVWLEDIEGNELRCTELHYTTYRKYFMETGKINARSTRVTWYVYLPE